jgi:SH3-like domain-containing protein
MRETGPGVLVPALTVAAGVVLVLLLAGITALLNERNAEPGAVAAAPTVTPAAAAVETPVRATAAPIIISSAAGVGTPSAAPSAATAAPAGASPAAAPAAATPAALVVVNTGGDGVNLRREPSAASPVVSLLAEGARLEQIGPDRQAEGRTWRNVRDAAGNQGWVAATFTQPATAGAALAATPAAATPAAAATPTGAAPPGGARPRYVVVNTEGELANLRREPALTAEIVAKLPEGARLEQIGPDRQAGGRTWRNVRDANGHQGWIAATLTRPVP